jgi:hypothetical protein
MARHPSDACYVSPFHSKHGQEKLYGTFTLSLITFQTDICSQLLNPISLHAIHLLVGPLSLMARWNNISMFVDTSRSKIRYL